MNWVKVTEIRNIPAREGRAVWIGERELAIFNTGCRFLAVENRCPHKGGPLADGIVAGDAVVCPLHSRRICLESGSVVKPTGEQACVRSYPVKVEQGVVMVAW